MKNMELLGFEKTKELLRQYKIPLVKTRLVKTKKEAKNFAKKIGWPLVLKISSSEVLHRTEKGLVKVGIENEKELGKAFDEIMGTVPVRGKSPAEGVLIQKMARGIEVACGMKRDVTFGPVLMFGLGGVFIELLKDVSFAIAPVNKREAMETIKKIKGYKILKGYRGKNPVNLDGLVKVLVGISKLSMEHSEIKEIDFNPIFVNEKRVQVADFKIITR